MDEVYTRQVKLLFDVLPEVAKEDHFALHCMAAQQSIFSFVICQDFR